jgi:hypothetical protein
VDDFETRVEIERVTEETLELADRIAERAAATSRTDPVLSRDVANFMQLRTRLRGLRRLRVAELAG